MTKRLKDELETISKWRTVIQNLPKKAAPTPPAQEDEPVGYITPVYILDKQDHAQISRNREYEWQVPLFSHPADDKLRQAAEEVLAILREEEEMCKGWVRDQNIKIQRVLSAALEGR